MPALFLTFLACLLVTMVGREQVRVARLAAAHGPGAPLIGAVWVSALLSSLFAAWLGSLMQPVLPGAAKQLFLAIAIAVAALETAFLRAGPGPAEPTRSTGATFLVLLGTQAADGTRFVVLALAAATGEPVLSGAGGAIGSGMALSVAVLAGSEWERKLPVRALAWAGGAILLLNAIVITASARGVFG